MNGEGDTVVIYGQCNKKLDTSNEFVCEMAVFPGREASRAVLKRHLWARGQRVNWVFLVEMQAKK